MQLEEEVEELTRAFLKQRFGPDYRFDRATLSGLSSEERDEVLFLHLKGIGAALTHVAQAVDELRDT